MTTLKMRSTTSYIVIFLFLCACLTLLLHEIVLYSTNTLSLHPEWIISSKSLLDRAPFGDEGESSRMLLRHNQLRLNEWHGFNEYLLNKILQPGAIRFRFSIAKNSYFYVIFNKTADGFSGIRISRSSNFPPIHFTADREGKFLLKQPLGDLHFGNGWQQFELTFLQGSLRITSQQGQSFSFAESNRPMQVIGFRAGANPAAIDDVQVVDASGRLITHENFRNHQIDWPLLIACISLSFLVAGILYTKRSNTNVLKKAIVGTVTLLLILLMYFIFDYYYWSAKYHFISDQEWKRTSDLPVEPFEQARLYIFKHLSSQISYDTGSFRAVSQFLLADPDRTRQPFIAVIGRPSAMNRYDRVNDNREAVQEYMSRQFPQNYKTILFIGSSQMFGMGATYPKDRIAFHVWENLTGSGVGNILVVNGAQPGTNSHELLRRCKSHLYLYKPSVVLINLSTNDATGQFREGLEELLDWTKAIGSKAIFIQEANTIELQRSSLLKKHSIMSEIATQAKAPLFGLNEFMSRGDTYDSGILWWDPVHMTSYGQRIAAEYLSNKLIETGFLNPTK